MTERVQEERRWAIEVCHCGHIRGGDPPARCVCRVDGDRHRRIKVVPASSLDQALAERDRWEKIANDEGDRLEAARLERDRLAEVAKELAETLRNLDRPDVSAEVLDHYESLRGEPDG